MINGVFHAAIHEFPEDVFTKEQRKRGAVLLHVLCVSILTHYHVTLTCYCLLSYRGTWLTILPF